MGNTTHIEWLLEGVDAWNGRIARDPNLPADLQSVDIREAFEAAGLCEPAQRLVLNNLKMPRSNLISARLTRCDLHGAVLDRSVLGYADLSGSNLLGASLRGAVLAQAVLVGIDLGEANLLCADLSKSRLARAKLGRARLGYANLEQARLRGADLYGSDLRHANLHGADLRGADLRYARLAFANLEKVDVRTVFLPHPSGIGTVREVTDLSTTIGLSQKQLNTMVGDLAVLLPQGLVHPDHWLPPTGERVERSRSQDAASGVTVDGVASAMSANRVPISLTGLSLLGHLSVLRDDILGNNRLGSEEPDLRDRMLAFVDDMIANTHQALDHVPERGDELTDEDAEEAAGFLTRWFGGAKSGFETILDPEKLGNTTAPAATVLSFGAFGYLVSGFNIIGFGAGSLFGRWVVQDIKFGAASEKAEKLLQPDASGEV